LFRLIPIAALAGLLVVACAAPAPSATPTGLPALPTADPATAIPPIASPTLAPTAAPVTPQPTPSATALATPSAEPTQSPPATLFPAGSVIVTFAVEAEGFKVLLTDPADITIAQALLAGEEAPPIPNGLVVRDDSGVNAPWSWHLDPDSIEFADITIEVCDALPSYVEEETLTPDDRYCPWSARVIAVERAGP
jgi:hypothetical protein